jgi:HSP20 family molecular chaperone IbpA
MAQEDSEAGNYYNEAAIEFIKRQGEAFRNIKEFDLEDRLRKFFCNVSETILKLDDDNEKINPENIKFEIDQDNNNRGKIVLDYQKNINLEIFCGDIISETFGEGKFCPEYSIESNENEILIYLDCPGNTSISKAEIKYPHNYINLIIAGKREKNNNIKTMGRKFGSGEFEVKINLHNKENIDDEESIKINQLGNGFYLLKIKKTNKE